MPQTNQPKVTVRPWQAEDIPAVVACQKVAYSDYPQGAHYDQRAYELQFVAFPEGQVLAELEGKVIGYSTSIIVQLDDDNHIYTYNEITGDGAFSTHDPSGDTLYGADIAVHPAYRGRGVSKRLYKARRRLMRRYNLRRMVAYGRLPGYNAVAGRMTAQEYVDAVVRGEMSDSALNAHLAAGYTVRGVVLDLMWDDSSLNYSTFLEMRNEFFKPEKRRIAASPVTRPVRRVRVCAAQYLMRPMKTWKEFKRSVEFFVTTADAYHCHFLLLPELFTAQLLSTMPQEWDARRAALELAAMADRLIDMFRGLAQQHSLYIIGGSTPVMRDGVLYNTAHLFTPSGRVYTQDKLHITPWERELWGVRPGSEAKVFETPLGRIAIQICYDIEFPEMARLLTLAGAELIFVPFSTDEKKAYYRVRYTAQARAVENYIYVVIAGNVGNLPSRHYLLNYGQAAVLTPSDFAFPLQATAGEADPNIETVVIAELDLTSLAMQREMGSVRPLYDRRPDLYDLRPKAPIRRIRTE